MTKREKITAAVAIVIHGLIVWHVWHISLKTPRNIQIINCEGEVIQERLIKPKEKKPKNLPPTIQA